MTDNNDNDFETAKISVAAKLFLEEIGINIKSSEDIYMQENNKEKIASAKTIECVEYLKSIGFTPEDYAHVYKLDKSVLDGYAAVKESVDKNIYCFGGWRD
jgi:hypothetical protein